ncbi:MAG: hypothetical protein PUP91_17095 [Rhizonema sp. PD37]|nr:hypothetical protein [Rhizonema sp. PD37]
MNDSNNLEMALNQLADLVKKSRLNSDWKYRSYSELVLHCGVFFKNQPQTPFLKRMTPRSCYYNCQKLAFENKELIYVEGYALAQDISFPLSHAWLMDTDGHVIEPTWEVIGTAYIGVPFSTAWIKSFLQLRERKDNLSIFEGNYLEGYSLLKEGLPTYALAD